MNFHDKFLRSFSETSSPGRGGIDFVERLTELRTAIAPQLEQIGKTFPEYTPHDWDGHIVPLFDIAARIFGEDELLALPRVTRFLVGVGLYAHDWGMAVSDEERAAISSSLSDVSDGQLENLMSDEKERLSDFVRKHGRSTPQIEEELLDDSSNLWPEYVRKTHAWRSGERTQMLLLSPDNDRALGDAGWAVCAGHWLDFKEVLSDRRFNRRMIGGEEASPRLAALIVRLVDLFDIGRDRTPFTLRKNVGPKDPRSVAEWDKHDALEQLGKVALGEKTFRLKVTGQCKDPEVWASLNDLRDYCRLQLEHSVRHIADECAEIRRISYRGETASIQIPDSALEWDVEPIGFMPVDLKFKFDEAGVFEILSSEIYQTDPHIFVRELLQNAIDATRRHVFQRDKETSTPVIEIGTQADEDGTLTVSCRDYGIGMDLAVIERYLAKIGSSFYSSEEFQRLFPGLPAISRFGIGILSCFTVADSIQIITRTQDPQGQGGSCFQIELKSIDRNCVVREHVGPFKPGTLVTVRLSREKLQKFSDATNSKIEFSVGGFLKANAAFVEFPIRVTTHGVQELILHPNEGSPESPKEYTAITQLNGRYRWNDVLDRIRNHPDPKILGDIVVDVRKDLDFENIEGFVAFPSPCPPDQDFSTSERSFDEESALVIHSTRIEQVPRSFDPVELSPYAGARNAEGNAASQLIYQDGILVESTGAIATEHRSFPLSEQYWINYTSERRATLTASRSRFASQVDVPPNEIVRQAKIFVLQRERERILALPLHQRARTLGWLMVALGLTASEMVRLLPIGQFPLLILEGSGQLRLTCSDDLSELKTIGLVPAEAINQQMRSYAMKSLSESQVPEHDLKYRGRASLFRFRDRSTSDQEKVATATMSLYDRFIDEAFTPIGLKIVSGPNSISPVVPKKIVARRTVSHPEENFHYLRVIRENMDSLLLDEWAKLRSRPPQGTDFLFPKLFVFPSSFASAFGFGTEFFNLSHPTVRFLVKHFAMACDNAGPLTGSSYKDAERIRSWIQSLLGNGKGKNYSYDVFSVWWDSFPAKLRELAGANKGVVPTKPSFSEFVSGTLRATEADVFQASQEKRSTFTDPSKWNDEWGIEL